MIHAAHSREHLAQPFAIGFFSNLSDAEQAVTSLRSVQFPLNQVMLIAHHFRRRDQFAGVNLSDRFENAGLEMPLQQERCCQERLRLGEYMMVVEGTEADLYCAAVILNPLEIQAWWLYSPAIVYQS